MRVALRRASIRANGLQRELDQKRDQIEQLLGVLQSMQKVSQPSILLHPAGPLDTVRSGMILSEVTPALQRQASELKSQLTEILVLRGLQRTAIDDLEQGLKGVQDARIALSLAMGQRTKLPPRLAADSAKLKRLAMNAKTLRDFARGLSDLPFANSKSPAKFEQLKGTLPLPVSGTVLRKFKEADAAGIRRPGLVLLADPASLVTAPSSATIRYAGPLLDYGNVIVLEPEAGYLLVLAGLGQVYAKVGEIVSAGDPLGLLRGSNSSAKDFLAEATQGNGEIRKETLYTEIRKDRVAVDPGAWFALKSR